MPSEEMKALSRVRLENAKERIGYAKQILELGDYKTVANRAYYAVFAAMRAVLALDGFDSKKHSGIISQFRKDYLKTGLFPKEFSAVIDSLVEIRQGSDYDDFYIVTQTEAVEQLHDAEIFVTATEEFLKGKN